MLLLESLCTGSEPNRGKLLEASLPAMNAITNYDIGRHISFRQSIYKFTERLIFDELLLLSQYTPLSLRSSASLCDAEIRHVSSSKEITVEQDYREGCIVKSCCNGVGIEDENSNRKQVDAVAYSHRGPPSVLWHVTFS
jgi:hypothetical protein